MRSRFVFLLLLSLLCSASPVSAQPQPNLPTQQSAVTMTIQAGLGGSYRSGEWFPVVVAISNDGADLRGDLEWQFPVQRNEQIFRYAIDLPRGSRKQVVMNVFSRGFARNGLVRVVTNGVIVAEQNVSVDPIDIDRYVIGVVSSDPTILNSLESLQLNGSNGTAVRHMTADQFPEQALALRSLNALYIHDADTTQLNQAQRDAIRLWTGLGGQLIVGGGVVGQNAIAGLADLLPVDLGSGISEADLLPIQQLGTGQLPSDARRAPVLALTPRAGAFDLTGGANLLISRRYGNGTTSVAAFDLSLLRGWAGEPIVWKEVMAPTPLFSPGIGSRTNQTSLVESALQLPGIGLPSPWVLLLFLVGYITVIGPINFFVLRRMRRLEWAWLSVPAIVLTFAGGLYLVGFGLRGSQSQVSQLTVVQLNEGQNEALATGFIALFSPSRSTYTINFPAATLLHETRGWDDINGEARPVLIDESSTTMQELLVDIASVRTLVAETPLSIGSPISSNVQNGGDPQSRGEIVNRGSAALDHVLIVRGGIFLDLGSMAPGASRSFDFANTGRNFPWAVGMPEDGLFNRKVLLTSLFSGDSTLYDSGNGPLGGNGLYVVAWADQPTLPVTINGAQQSQSGYTLYVIRLNS
ncbi:MAG: hypothetical protein Fur005_01930 [Roseiflexaceae bacterium]